MRGLVCYIGESFHTTVVGNVVREVPTSGVPGYYSVVVSYKVLQHWAESLVEHHTE